MINCCLGQNTSCKNLLMTELTTFKYNVRHTKFDGHTSILNEKNQAQTQLNLIDIFGTIWLYVDKHLKGNWPLFMLLNARVWLFNVLKSTAAFNILQGRGTECDSSCQSYCPKTLAQKHNNESQIQFPAQLQNPLVLRCES